MADEVHALPQQSLAVGRLRDPLSERLERDRGAAAAIEQGAQLGDVAQAVAFADQHAMAVAHLAALQLAVLDARDMHQPGLLGKEQVDLKSTRLNSSHQIISYAVFCLKKKKNSTDTDERGVTNDASVHWSRET